MHNLIWKKLMSMIHEKHMHVSDTFFTGLYIYIGSTYVANAFKAGRGVIRIKLYPSYMCYILQLISRCKFNIKHLKQWTKNVLFFVVSQYHSWAGLSLNLGKKLIVIWPVWPEISISFKHNVILKVFLTLLYVTSQIFKTFNSC